ncbi:MAG: hypothetical protein ACLP59_18835 [Bryobacteraceae bacterium]
MRAYLLPLAAVFVTSLASCGSEPKPAAPAPEKPAAAKPADESRRFPIANRLDTQVVDNQLLGKPFMPGGTLAHFKRGKTEYSMFIAKAPTAQDAAFLLLDWDKAMTGAKIEPAFGGYFGQDAGQPVFVFAKGAWIAGVAGLPEKDADLAARSLAAHLD